MRPISLFAVVTLAGCYSIPMPLSEWGAMDATVSAEGEWTTLGSAKLVPQQGCPTFTGDATMNDSTMTPVSAGQAVITGPAYAPGTLCVGPEFASSSYTSPTTDGLTFTMSDESDTWTADDSMTFGWFIVDDRALYPEESTVHVALDRDVEVLSVSVTGGSVGEGGSPTFAADDDGGYAVVLLPRWSGEVTLWITAVTRFEAETCEGFASCTMEATVTTDLTLQVR